MSKKRYHFPVINISIPSEISTLENKLLKEIKEINNLKIYSEANSDKSLVFAEEFHMYFYLKKIKPTISNLNQVLTKMSQTVEPSFISEKDKFYRTTHDLMLGYIINESIINQSEITTQKYSGNDKINSNKTTNLNSNPNKIVNVNFQPRKRLIRIMLYPNIQTCEEARENGGYKYSISLSKIDISSNQPKPTSKQTYLKRIK